MAPPQDTILTRPMLHHYDVDEVGPLHYIFTTIGGSIYDLSFINVGEYDSLPVYAFNIDRKEAEHCNGSDNMVRNTVAYVLHLFFENIDNAILSTCDIDDGKHNARYRLFKRWFNDLNDGNFTFLESQVNTGYGKTWAMLYYHKDSILVSLIKKYFEDYLQLMNEL